MTAPPLTASLDWLVKGYRCALARFYATAEERDPDARFIPLFEALNWAVAILDFTKDRGQSINDDTVRGLRLARHRVHHQWADALEARDVPNPVVTRPVGPGSRIVMPPTRLEWFWKPLNQLPAAPPSHHYPKLEAAYSAQLAGNPAQDALTHLDGLLP